MRRIASFVLILLIFDQANAATCPADAPAANLDFKLEDMHGKTYDLNQHKKKVILIDFWATWCAPCRIEIPGFVKLYKQYKEAGLEIIGISIDDPPDAARRFAEEFEMNYPVLIGDGRDDVKNALGPLVGFPTTILINRKGQICHRHVGFAPYETFRSEIEALLAADV